MTTQNYAFRQERILRELRNSGATIEDLAQAWASMDGKEDRFNAEKNMHTIDVTDGTYLGYICETEEILQRATQYAIKRRMQRRLRFAKP